MAAGGAPAVDPSPPNAPSAVLPSFWRAPLATVAASAGAWMREEEGWVGERGKKAGARRLRKKEKKRALSPHSAPLIERTRDLGPRLLLLVGAATPT